MARPLVWLHTLADVRFLPIHDLGELTIEDRFNDLETLTFTIRADDPKAFAVQADRLVEHAGRYYRVEELNDFRDSSGKPMTEVYCEARWMDLGKRSRAGTYSVLAKTPLQGMTLILAGTGWTPVFDSPADASLYSMEDIDASNLTLIRRWASIVGREVVFDTAAKTVTFVEQVGEDRGVGFRYGHNLREVSRRYRPPVATRLYPFGANNLNIAATNPSGLTYIEDYSWYTAQGLNPTQAAQLFRKDQVWYDARYLLGVTLYDAAVRRLASIAQPTISYELAVADFATLTGSTADDVQLGDVVRVRDPDFGIDIATRVVRLVEKPLRPQDNEIELDYLQPGLAEVADPESSRSLDYNALSLLVDENADPVEITSGTLVWGAISITLAGASTYAAGGTIRGVADGSGTVRFGLYLDGTPVGDTFDFAFTTGQQVEFSWPTMQTGLEEGSYSVEWRAQVVSGSGTIDVAAGAARAWLISSGAVGAGGVTNPSQLIIETLLPIDPDLILPLSDDWSVSITEEPEDIWLDFTETTPALDPLDLTPLVEDWIADTTPLVSVVDTAGETYGGATNVDEIELTVPASSEENDLVVVVLTQQSGSSDITAPAGFSLIAQQANVAGNQWTEVWTADDDGTLGGTLLTFTATTPSPMAMMVLVLRDSDGVGVTTEDTASTNYNAGAGAEPFSSITSTGIGRLALAVSGCLHASAVGATTYSTPTGYTIHTEPTVPDTPAYDRNRLMVATRVTAVETVSGRTTTHSGATHDAGTVHILFRPL